MWASVCVGFFSSFHCDCGNPALLPSGMLSVSGAAEEKHSRGCLEKSRHMLPLSLPAFTLAAFLVCFPVPSLSHGETDQHPGGPTVTFFLHLFRYSVCAHCALFHHPSFCPVVPSCLFMLLLLLPDIFRDELQSTARGKKLEGEQFEQRASCFLPSHFHEDPFFSLQDHFFSITSFSL